MDNNSTQLPLPTVSSPSEKRLSSAAPKKSTLDYIRQFARIYMPMDTMPGILLN